MSSTSPRSGGPPLDAEIMLLWGAITVVFGTVLVLVGATHLAMLLDGSRERLPANPVALAIDLARGRSRWPADATAIAAALAGLLLATVTAVAWRWQRSQRRHVDRAARWMGRGTDVERLTARRAAATAQRLGVEQPGLPIGRAGGGGRMLYMGWEDVAVDVWGPRTGKTTSRAIPSILAAPGAVLATSNKRDLVDASRDVRAERGRVWVFDPQGIAGERPSWWWNPISYVTDEVRAIEMADVFALASREVGARTDAFFDTAGQNLVAQLLLAAALDRRELTQVYLWLSAETDDEPVQILTEHGYQVIAGALQAQINAPEKQRGGVFGTAREMCAFMTNRDAMAWVTPPRDHRPQFDPRAFASSTDTLYSLSKEGKAGAGPLVTGLTLAVCEAAEDLAKTCRGGRLPVPMVAVLDEAANVCRWRKLPDLYSHYGSRGILLMTILQSFSQGVEAWGRDGMRKLWSAATVKVYGGGVTEVEFLEELSKLVGEYDQLNRSDTRSYRQGRSSNRQVRPARILDVADLASMPQGRIVVIASGTRPTLATPIPWMAGTDAAKVRASLQAHDPVNDAREGVA
ncbi:type IV secretory system conjugative DNA transfer family protein [Conexibacter sp. DBS9H8]|uniref:type IV secretory system conjugative DNA transfer family protein n=1 Tax=Conexibacter sp. DBS9H8 TaxID=2937801 RepID=UPI00200C1903|nr:TraM recognition domain-containing protein [Conexibacter sp. DBS9H8]